MRNEPLRELQQQYESGHCGPVEYLAKLDGLVRRGQADPHILLTAAEDAYGKGSVKFQEYARIAQAHDPDLLTSVTRLGPSPHEDQTGIFPITALYIARSLVLQSDADLSADPLDIGECSSAGGTAIWSPRTRDRRLEVYVNLREFYVDHRGIGDPDHLRNHLEHIIGKRVSPTIPHFAGATCWTCDASGLYLLQAIFRRRQ